MRAVENLMLVSKAKYLEIVNYGICDYMEEFLGLFQIAYAIAWFTKSGSLVKDKE